MDSETKKNYLLLSIIIALLVFFVGCASFNKSHTTNFANQQKMVNQGNINMVVQKLEKKAKKGGREGVLHSLEAGYYYLFLKDYQKSKELFNIAENQIHDYEERAKVNARDIGAKAKAAIASDMELPYKGETFEKVMMNTLLTLDFMFQKNLEGARVEVRKAELRQKEAEEKHQKELKKIEDKKKEKKFNEKSFNSVFDNYNVLNEYSAKIVNSFQNSFTYYLGGLIYELNQDLDDSYKDYYKSFSLSKNKFTLSKLLELSKQLEYKDDFKKWEEMYNDLFKESPQISQQENNKNGELVVIFFNGSVPKKIQAKFSLWLPKKSFNVAFPFYDKNTFYGADSFLQVSHSDALIGNTEIVLDFIPIVVKSLKEKLPGIVVRQLLRLIAKNAVEKQASKRAGFLGRLTAKVLNTVTERADLRGWYELPENIQILRANLAPGQTTLSLKRISENNEFFLDNIDITVKEKSKILVLVQELAAKNTIHTVQFN